MDPPVNQLNYQSIEKSYIRVPAIFILTLSLIFLQEGFNYYVSFQILALITVATLIFSTTRTIKAEMLFSVAFFVFTFFLAITAVSSPKIISENSSNIFITSIGVLGYAVMIGCLPHLKMKRASLILHVLRSVSLATILALAGILVVSESKVVPSLDRKAMTQQNSRLIDNFSDPDALSADDAINLLLGQTDRIDLFYGEPSFLAIVLFTCLGCFIITSKFLVYTSHGEKHTSFKSYELILSIGIILLLYVQSFSSIIYALIVIYFAFIKGKIKRENLLPSITFLIVFGIVFLAISYEYLIYRFTQTDSVSFAQRFGFLLDIGIEDLLIGIKDVPTGGIQNGLLYIIAIAGFGGILYVTSLLRSVYTLSTPIKSSTLLILLVLAIMMQNGGVFSPGKVVLFSLVLLPLACARTIYSARQCPASINSYQHA